MTDEELVKMVRRGMREVDIIEALTAEKDEHWKSFVHWRKEADALTEQLKTVLDREAATTARYDAKLETLTEQLEAARADAKEAEAYAEELERDLKTCRMAQAVMDNTVAELEKQCEGLMQAGMNNGQALILAEAKLAKAVSWFEAIRDRAKGDYMANTYYLDALAALATIERSDAP
jgi:chromosome segregation ATPase